MILVTAAAPRLACSFVALFLLASVAWAQPQLEVSPPTLAQSLGPGTTTEQDLTVTNVGTEALTFTAARGPATASAGGPDDSVTTHSSPGWRSTFQVILDPGGNILFQYLDRSAPFSGTVGIENADATDGLEISHNAFPAYVRDSLAVRIDAPTPWLTVSPASGTVAAGESIDLTLTLDADTLEQAAYVAMLRTAVLRLAP